MQFKNNNYTTKSNQFICDDHTEMYVIHFHFLFGLSGCQVSRSINTVQKQTLTSGVDFLIFS